jgi:hypothetical protein
MTFKGVAWEESAGHSLPARVRAAS